MSLTGGELNILNGKYGVSAPNKSVPVMALIREHKPKSHEELYRLIDEHSKRNCKCGIKSQGTVENFGYTDWRIPNVKEFQSLSDYSEKDHESALPEGEPFNSAPQYMPFWTSTSDYHDGSYAWCFHTDEGLFIKYLKSEQRIAWPVRGGH